MATDTSVGAASFVHMLVSGVWEDDAETHEYSMIGIFSLFSSLVFFV